MEEFIDVVAGGTGWGLGIGIALGALALTGGVKPVTKLAVRGYMAARRTVGEVGEQLQDAYHEARTEYRQESAVRAINSIETKPMA